MDEWPHNLVCVPGTNGNLRAHRLDRSLEHFIEGSFAIIPYVHPLREKIRPYFLKIENEISDFSPPHATPGNLISLKALTDKQTYLRNVAVLKKHIQLGNIYEINYCISFSAENSIIDPFAVFKKLFHETKAPYSYLVKLGEYFIICCSPELFLKKEGSTVFTKPIKGTARRGRSKEEDESLKTGLRTSLKERTENVMAVDVARNDLSRFAEKGSVTVNRLFNIETFENVHQMVSTVSCKAKRNTGFTDMLDATFPMASMTGAPKISAMNLIDEFEGFRRNYYSGAMGFVNSTEDFELSVIIRSIFYDRSQKKLSFAVGGAITHFSDPETEYEECLLKANAMMKALSVKENV